jgi:RHS repeat-associated protein
VDYSFQTDESYTYDDNGNRTNAGYVMGVNNRLLEDNKFRYEYDVVGNRTKRTDKLTAEVTNYSWDVRDRLTGLVVKNALGEEVRSAGYTYDVYNQRIAKTVDMDGAGAGVATTERYVYGGDQNIDLIFDQNGNVSHRYLFGAGVDQIEADESNGSVLWALTDHLGSVRDVVDNAGVVQNHVVYDAFGGVTSQSNSSVVFRYGYTARELDAESGLQYNRARYLDSFNGRFISEDPAGVNVDANLYRYAFNQPVTMNDPEGLTGRIVPGTFQSNPASGGNRMVKARIFWSDGENDGTTYLPVGGVVTRGDLQPPGTKHEDNGHIIPALLGGSEVSRIQPTINTNFFSQDVNLNRGAYRVFGEKVDAALYKMNEAWKRTRDYYRNERNNSCTCFDLGPAPQKPYIEYKAYLTNNAAQGSLESYYPQRPTQVEVWVDFVIPEPWRYSPLVPSGGFVQFIFSNNIRTASLTGGVSKPNSTRLNNNSPFWFNGASLNRAANPSPDLSC